MKMKYVVLYGLCIVVLSIFCYGFDSSPQPPVTLELSLLSVNLAIPEIIIQLTVTNTSRYRIMLPHLKDGLIERHDGWWGWGIVVKNHQSRPFWYVTSQPRPPMLQQDDLITLQPGEHFTVTINIAGMKLRTYYVENKEELDSRLAGLDGAYEVSAGYGLSGSALPVHVKDLIWKGSASSDTLTFVVIHEKRRMYFPGKQAQLISPDGQYLLINVEHGSKEQRIALGGKYGLYLRDVRTGEQQRIYSYNDYVEVVWSPEGSSILINAYGGRTGDSYYASAFIFFVGRKALMAVKDQLRQTIGDDPHIFGNQYVRIMGTHWLSEQVLRISIDGAGDVDPGSFQQSYEYDVLHGEFKPLEQFFPLGINPEGKTNTHSTP